MPEDKPLPPELEPLHEDDAGDDTEPLILDAQARPVLETPVDSPVTAPDVHDLPTMPIQTQERPAPLAEGDFDAKQTLPGTGGLDPNPDFETSRRQTVSSQPPALDSGQTVPHIVPFQHTMVHVPGEQHSAYRPPQHSAQPPAIPGPQFTQPMPPPPQYTQPTGGVPGARPGMPSRPGLPQRPKRPRRILGCTPGCFMVFAGLVATFCGGLTLVALLLTATLGARLEASLQEQVDRVEAHDNFQSTFFYDRNGTLLFEAFSEGRRVNVSYDQFPQELILATIAIEDDTFFTNPGFEVQATLRAFLQFVGLAEGSTGGSTITQQLVRNVLFDFDYRAERSVQRKIEEILLAFLLRQRMSAEDVLAMYLNEIYYGNLAYGAEAAAQTFFNKSVGELTLGEAALLAGLPQAPANLDPFNQDPRIQQAVEARWRLVLDRMVQEGFITNEQRNEALREGYSIVPPEAPLRAPHFTVYARQELEALMSEIGYSPEQIARGGLRVYTTVDLQIHDLAQRIAREQVAGLAANRVSNAAVLVLQPITGEIMAMVGSIDYNNEAIDGRVNVTIAQRQPGSTVKAFTYSAAIEQGMSPGDVIWDTETQIGDYRPVNYDRTFHGPVRMRDALANSYNVPAVQTLRQVGVDNLLALFQRFGVTSLSDDASRYGLSLTLGGGEMTLLELTRAYSVFANGGAYVPTTAIRCVLDNEDRILYEYANGCPRGRPTEQTVFRDNLGTQILDPRIAFLIGDILSDNVARTPAMGANSPLNTGAIPAAVKTGTTDDFRDNWTVGYTRNVAVGVWVGNSRGEPMVNVSGLMGAAPIWNAVITGIYNNQNLLAKFAIDGSLLPDRLDSPGGITLRALCRLSALREPATECTSTVNEWLLDSPAGIPDGNGGLYFPPAPNPPPDQPPPSGPWLREVEPGIFRVLVHPIPPAVAQGIVFAVAPGQPQPPPPLYCQVPIELAASAPAAREQLFIAPPPVPEDAVRAEQYARAQGLAFLPTIACSPELLSATGGPTFVTAFISQPANGQVINGPIPIIGTAQFTPEQAWYYKVEIIGGPFPEWRTIGDIHYNSVVNGVLENLAALEPGSYQLQLVIVGNDGNYVQPPYTVSFLVQ